MTGPRVQQQQQQSRQKQAAALHGPTARPPLAVVPDLYAGLDPPRMQQAPAAGNHNNNNNNNNNNANTAEASAPLLDKFLVEQAELTRHPAAHAQLLPTVHNISSLHLPAERLTQLAKLQQWVKDKLGFEEVPITNGSFVLVSAADLSDDPLACSTGTAAVAAATTGSSAPAAHAAAAAMPLRLRQVAAIQVPPGVAAADGVCVLEGGQSVRVGAVVGGRLQEVPDPQHLCNELAHLTLEGQLRQLSVLEVANTAWRLAVAGELQAQIDWHEQELVRLLSSGYSMCFAQLARDAAVMELRSTLMQLPPTDWIQSKVLPTLELDPHDPQQPLTAERSTQLLQAAADAWQAHVQQQQQQQKQQHQLAAASAQPEVLQQPGAAAQQPGTAAAMPSLGERDWARTAGSNLPAQHSSQPVGPSPASPAKDLRRITDQDKPGCPTAHKPGDKPSSNAETAQQRLVRRLAMATAAAVGKDHSTDLQPSLADTAGASWLLPAAVDAAPFEAAASGACRAAGTTSQQHHAQPPPADMEIDSTAGGLAHAAAKPRHSLSSTHLRARPRSNSPMRSPSSSKRARQAPGDQQQQQQQAKQVAHAGPAPVGSGGGRPSAMQQQPTRSIAAPASKLGAAAPTTTPAASPVSPPNSSTTKFELKLKLQLQGRSTGMLPTPTPPATTTTATATAAAAAAAGRPAGGAPVPASASITGLPGVSQLKDQPAVNGSAGQSAAAAGSSAGAKPLQAPARPVSPGAGGLKMQLAQRYRAQRGLHSPGSGSAPFAAAAAATSTCSASAAGSAAGAVRCEGQTSTVTPEQQAGGAVGAAGSAAMAGSSSCKQQQPPALAPPAAAAAATAAAGTALPRSVTARILAAARTAVTEFEEAAATAVAASQQRTTCSSLQTLGLHGASMAALLSSAQLAAAAMTSTATNVSNAAAFASSAAPSSSAMQQQLISFSIAPRALQTHRQPMSGQVLDLRDRRPPATLAEGPAPAAPQQQQHSAGGLLPAAAGTQGVAAAGMTPAAVSMRPSQPPQSAVVLAGSAPLAQRRPDGVTVLVPQQSAAPMQPQTQVRPASSSAPPSTAPPLVVQVLSAALPLAATATVPVAQMFSAAPPPAAAAAAAVLPMPQVLPALGRTLRPPWQQWPEWPVGPPAWQPPDMRPYHPHGQPYYGQHPPSMQHPHAGPPGHHMPRPPHDGTWGHPSLPRGWW